MLAGNLKAAEAAAAKVKDAKEKERASLWLAAGRFVEAGRADAATGAEIAAMESELAAIAEAKCEAGNLEMATQILAVMKDADCRARVHIGMAELQLKRNLKAEFRASIDLALKDLQYAKRLFEDQGAPAPLLDCGLTLYLIAKLKGLGGHDSSEIARHYKKLLKLE